MATVDSPHPTLPSCIIFRNRRGGSGRPQALRHRDVIEDTSSTVGDFTFFLSRARPPARCDQRRAPPDPRGPEARPSSSRARSSLFGLWRICFPPVLVRTGRRLPVQALGERGSLGYRDRLPARRGPGTGLKLCHQGFQKSKRNLVYGVWSQQGKCSP